MLDRKEPKPLSHLHLLSCSALLPNIYKLTSFIANFAPLVKNGFSFEDRIRHLAFLPYNEYIFFVFSSMENNNSYGAAFCQDSQVIPNGTPRFLLKKRLQEIQHWQESVLV